MGAVNNEASDSRLFFIDGPGGSGKSFLLEKILASVRMQTKVVLAVASSGIAALQLMGGRTAHSMFKLPLNLSAESTCNISAQSQRAELLRRAVLIVWDEAPMAHKLAFEALDRTLRDLMENEHPFGGKVVVLSGDFRQILPVVPKGGSADIIHACIKRSELWPRFQSLRLQVNMRVRQASVQPSQAHAEEFSRFLLRVGEGRANTCTRCGPGYARVPRDIVLLAPDGEDPLETLIATVYNGIQDQYLETDYFTDKAILTPLNVDVHGTNDRIVDLIPGNIREYNSLDTIEEEEGLDRSLFPTEFLNSLTVSGMPPHKLRLEVSAPIMLLRNIDGDQGLCNGTRLTVLQLRPNCILARIITGTRKGQVVAIPRIPLISSESGLPFKLRRRQFPIQLAFAMTINKAQGQTVDQLGIYLPAPVFTHGQFYVAISRSTSPNRIKIVVRHSVHEDDDGFCILNVVFPGVAT